MTYLLTNRRNNQKNYRKLLESLVLGAFLVAVFYFGRAGIKGLVAESIYPVLSFSQKISQNVKAGFLYLVPDGTLERENATLKAEIARLENEIFEGEIIRLENEEMRYKLGYWSEENFIPVSILLLPPQTPYDTALVDKGAVDGIEKGDKMLFGSRTVLGEIEEVWERRSSARLYSSSGVKTEVMIERTGVIVGVEGVGGSNFKLEAPMDFDIKKDDILVLTSVPRRAVAVAVEVKIDESSSFLTAYLRVPANISGLSPIYIEKIR